MRKNILFIMCDQLRFDYLSCAGHPHLDTPNIDRLAARGVQFTRAYVQAPLCGPSRMSFLTGRYMSSHGVCINSDPPRVGERLMGHYLHEMGVRTAVVGKSSVRPNHRALKQIGIDPLSRAGQAILHGGFEEVWRDDGIHPDPIVDDELPYNNYLRRMGYDTANPWDRNANGVLGEEGEHLSGWLMRHANRPADIAEEHSETAYTTDCAIKFIEEAEARDEAWCLHLSYIKPHWPYIVPAPYHDMYGVDDIIPARKTETERHDPHPVYGAFMQSTESQSFAREEVRERVIPAYMGLIKQIDDHVGRLIETLEAHNLFDNTLIVFTSDHGDYLGDHWLGEKYLFHEPSVRIPLIVCDPDGAHGAVDERFVEAIDLLPTFINFLGKPIPEERLEGRSLLPLLRDELIEPIKWRDAVFSELDYNDSGARHILGRHPYACRAYMVRTARWKYILHEGFRPQLFDLNADPHEVVDLGDDPLPLYTAVRHELHERIFAWSRQRKMRTERPTETLFGLSPESDVKHGILIGHW